MHKALEQVRYPGKAYPSLPVDDFIALGCLRQILSINTLREQIQHLFHLNETATRTPVARSTWSDALGSHKRLAILREAMQGLIKNNIDYLPDRYENISALDNRPVYALDVTYQTESTHFYPMHPSQGGDDNQKGHLLLHTYDMRRGVPVDVGVDTHSIGEMRFVKERWECSYWAKQKNALYVVDRAFVDFRYWDIRKKEVGATVISRMKENFKYEVLKTRKISDTMENEGILGDFEIAPKSSKQTWRLIRFEAPCGTIYEYLSNDLTLEPGLIAFLYYRRWDEEKYFDAYKNDMASSKAWGKSAVSIEQQGILGIVTYLLTRLFLVKTSATLDLDEDKKLQETKHNKKLQHYYDVSGAIGLRAFYRETSKITKQVWRFLRGNFIRKDSERLYEQQLRPILTGYL
jgi:hypothetical protein